MREILFRAKHIHTFQKNKHLDGVWVYGYLEDKDYINSPELEGEFLIDPETVCEYTGLTDKNGRKIFEGIFATEKKNFPKLLHIITEIGHLIIVMQAEKKVDATIAILGFM